MINPGCQRLFGEVFIASPLLVSAADTGASCRKREKNLWYPQGRNDTKATTSVKQSKHGTFHFSPYHSVNLTTCVQLSFLQLSLKKPLTGENRPVTYSSQPLNLARTQTPLNRSKFAQKGRRNGESRRLSSFSFPWTLALRISRSRFSLAFVRDQTPEEEEAATGLLKHFSIFEYQASTQNRVNKNNSCE